MIIADKIRDEKLQYDINREEKKYQLYHKVKLININILQAKKYYLLIKVEWLEQVYLPSFGKSFWKTNKPIEALEVLKPEENKQDLKSIEGIFPKEMRTNETKNELDEFKKWEEKLSKEI